MIINATFAYEHNDPDPEAALTWTAENIFRLIPGYDEDSAWIEESEEDDDDDVPNDLRNEIRGHFSISARSDKAAEAKVCDSLPKDTWGWLWTEINDWREVFAR